MELTQIEGFRKVVASKVVNVNNSMQIVDNARKCLFLEAKETNWDANVWYMEHFQLQRERMNPSNLSIRLSFLEVKHKVPALSFFRIGDTDGMGGKKINILVRALPDTDKNMVDVFRKGKICLTFLTHVKNILPHAIDG